MAANKKTEEWVSPIGQTHEQVVARKLRENPEYRAIYERNRPYREIARKAILRRGELRLSQSQVAHRMGTTKSAISRIESGRHRSSLLTLEKLAEALEMQLEIDFEPKPTKRSSRRPTRKRSTRRAVRVAA